MSGREDLEPAHTRALPPVITSVKALRQRLAQARRRGASVGFVPTMGNLHGGHLALVQRAACCDVVVVSIFVNPLQFGGGEDFERYPRTLDQDRQALAGTAGELLVFAPSVAEMNPFGDAGAVSVSVPGLTDILCGRFRPGHFEGVATVVNKLLNIVGADLAVFGEKDLQQLRVIERLVADLHIPTRIVPGPIEREADGLAMSSRNRYLTSREREIAPTLHGELSRVAAAAGAGGSDHTALEETAADALTAAGFRVDYVSIRRRSDLAAPMEGDRELVVLAAARLGSARLIDNVPFDVAGG